MPAIVSRQTLTARDTILYALGVGAIDLDFVYGQRLKALPTIASVLAFPDFIWKRPEIGADWKNVLHGEQSISIHQPLLIEGVVRGETTFESVVDKGATKGAIAYVKHVIFDDQTNTLIATARMSTFLRGDGGCGGTSSDTPKPHSIPDDRDADQAVTNTTSPDQALLYRLSGDWNPLHIDAAIAAAAGFDRPILHGLCSYGVVGLALLGALADNDPARLARMDCRFTAPVYPGETIRTEIWRTGDGEAAFRASVVERDIVIMNNGYAEFT